MAINNKLIKKLFKEIDNNPFIPNRPLLGYGPRPILSKTDYKVKVLNILNNGY